jgi:hypothetical protein
LQVELMGVDPMTSLGRGMAVDHIGLELRG